VTGRISKYSIYATRLSERHPWKWWARPPWHPPVQFGTWAEAARYLTMRHRLAQTERDERANHRRHRE